MIRKIKQDKDKRAKLKLIDQNKPTGIAGAETETTMATPVVQRADEKGKSQVAVRHLALAAPTENAKAKHLDQAGEQKLLRLAFQGDKRALDALIRHLRKGSRASAAHYSDNSIGREFDDLCQEGDLGALKSISKFDCVRHSRLSTYSSYWIRNSIIKCLNRNNGAIRLPKRIYAIGRAVKNCTVELSFRLGRSPNNAEISAHTGFTLKNVEDARKFERLQDVRSLDEALDETEDSLVLGETISCQKSAQPEHLAEVAGLREFTTYILNSLDDRERIVVESKYGLANREEMTFKEIGMSLGISKQRAQQIESGVIRKFRAKLKKVVREYLEDPSGTLTPSDHDEPGEIRNKLYCLILEELERRRGHCAKEALMDVVIAEVKTRLDLRLLLKKAKPEDDFVPPEEWIYWDIQHLISQKLLREAFSGEELVVTDKGNLWLQAYYRLVFRSKSW